MWLLHSLFAVYHYIIFFQGTWARCAAAAQWLCAPRIYWEDSHHLRSTAKSQLLLKAAGLRSSRAVQGQTSPVAFPNVWELKNTGQFVLQAWLELQEQVWSTREISLAGFSHSFKLIYGLWGHGYADTVLNGYSALWSFHSNSHTCLTPLWSH